MGTKEIPARYVFTCDRCAVERDQRQTQGSQPEGWFWARFNGTSRAVKSYLLCDKCGKQVMELCQNSDEQPH